VLRVQLDYEPFAGGREVIGELALYGDERVLWSRLRAEVAAIIMTQVVQSLLLASLIMLMFNKLVTVHVRRIAQHLGKLTPANLAQHLRLDRNTPRNDELSQLVAGVNQLQGNLSDYLEQQQQYEQELLVHRDNLAQLVKERTTELEAANARLDSLARTDTLTGLANRRQFDEVKHLEFHRAQRYGHPLSLLVCDIDHFKRYNDAYGHATGDQCLRLIAQALRDGCSRATDLVARLGGEEFAILLPATDAAHAAQIADRLRLAVSRLAIEHKESDTAPHVTISLGVAQLDPGRTRTFDELFEQADAALYEAKAGGRNRCVVHIASG
jgi:diguanylate cyclase (GGDEF)-like protein